MIPKIIVFKDSSIESAITQYENQMPAIVEQFEKENGECQVSPGIIYNPNLGDFIITVMLTISPVNKITQSGMELMSQLQNRITQSFNAEGCDHDWDSSADDQGNEKIICKKCGTPLA